MEVIFTPEKRNQDNLWRLQPESYHVHNRKAYAAVKLDRDDDHFRLLEMISALSEAQSVKLVFFVNPLNRAMNRQQRYWTTEQFTQFCSLTREIVEAHGNRWVNLVDAVDNRFFTDEDHLNMNGHAQLAAALAGPVADALEGTMPPPR